MKKALLTLITVLVIFSFEAHAQWSGTNPLTTSSNVGIGTTSPGNTVDISSTNDTQLRIGESSASTSYTYDIGRNTGTGFLNFYGNQSGYNGYVFGGANGTIMTMINNGNVGIGATSPTQALEVNGVFYLTSAGYFGGGVVAGGSSDLGIRSAGSLYFGTNNSTTSRMNIDGSGNVGIGTTDPQGYKLAVNGDMIATSVKVKLYADWPDYVFKPKYHLPALSTVKTYIEQNQHLPGMPSEQEVSKDGLNLGATATMLTKKVEELTLYLIDKDKQVENLEKQSRNQQEQLNLLKQQLSQLIKKSTAKK